MGSDLAIDETVASDAAFLSGVVLENEHWNDYGISEPDMSVVFEMNQRCGWGQDFTVTRFRQAVRELADSPHVEKRGQHWFASTNRRLDVMDEAGKRLCERSGCKVDITHLRANTRYCSDRCRKMAHKG